MPKIVAEIYQVGTVTEVQNDVSAITIFDEYVDALYKIEDMEYLDILFWIPLKRDVLKVHPKGNPSNPLRGVFSTRSPKRPNNIGITTVKLLRSKGNTLYVEGLDAFKNTAIIDIKSGRNANGR
ncbi:MAG: tRNA (N6-threonylcarbamoyladenosine(37)-N6)-methyltransferase TrmO [Candidatus Methanofastidiosia archaeon]